MYRGMDYFFNCFGDRNGTSCSSAPKPQITAIQDNSQPRNGILNSSEVVRTPTTVTQAIESICFNLSCVKTFLPTNKAKVIRLTNRKKSHRNSPISAIGIPMRVITSSTKRIGMTKKLTNPRSILLPGYCSLKSSIFFVNTGKIIASKSPNIKYVNTRISQPAQENARILVLAIGLSGLAVNSLAVGSVRLTVPEIEAVVGTSILVLLS